MLTGNACLHCPFTIHSCSSSGGFGLVWFAVWLFLAYERPAYHPTITEEELKYIEERQGDAAIQYKVCGLLKLEIFIGRDVRTQIWPSSWHTFNVIQWRFAQCHAWNTLEVVCSKLPFLIHFTCLTGKILWTLAVCVADIQCCGKLWWHQLLGILTAILWRSARLSMSAFGSMTTSQFWVSALYYWHLILLSDDLKMQYYCNGYLLRFTYYKILSEYARNISHISCEFSIKTLEILLIWWPA